ncbi:hypothetical protein AQUSIP_12590 [Aquicella siphonis]|uniref:Uncharacterized protein n=1 Tax=Aquicella siphonis TaxID=254247 RepID=A0A5E4PHG0_9COXI|nr:hypothetical protein AQUSIP_12590 [Aquicella siphonis]
MSGCFDSENKNPFVEWEIVSDTHYHGTTRRMKVAGGYLYNHSIAYECNGHYEISTSMCFLPQVQINSNAGLTIYA